MREWRWAWIGVVLGLVAALLLFAPALWLANALRLASDDRLQLAQPRGTVWDGNGRLVLSGGISSRDAVVLPDRITWRLRPRWMGLQLQLQAACCMSEPLQMTAKLSWRSWTVAWADNTSRWPAAVLAGLGSPWNTLQPQGRLVLALQGLSLESLEGRNRVDGNLVLDALDLSSRLSTLKPIGSYRLRLVGNGLAGPPLMQLQTLEGRLQLTGQGQWNGTRWGFRGEASAAAEDEPVLGNLLNIVGRRQGSRSIIAVD